MASSSLEDVIGVTSSARNFHVPELSDSTRGRRILHQAILEWIERLTIYNAVPAGISVALMTVTPLRASESVNYLAISRYLASGALILSFGAIIVGQSAIVLSRHSSDSCSTAQFMKARFFMIITLCLSVTSAISLFISMAFLL
ncbi:hypothetical protein FRC03_002959 [Tulasnella sp. 419]|nr:hypothetical protein FRC03_002959 [Tulasnella sp. 419]